MEGLYEDTSEEVVEEVAVHMKMGFKYHMSPVTLRTKSGTRSETEKRKSITDDLVSTKFLVNKKR